MVRRIITPEVLSHSEKSSPHSQEVKGDTHIASPAEAMYLQSSNRSDESQEPNRSNEPQEGESFGSEFLDNLAHQMVAPLQSIERHCGNILDGKVPGDRRDSRLKEVIGHARILQELARRMRFLHELVNGKIIQTETLEFKEIVTIWIDCYNNYLPFIQQRDIQVDIPHEKMNHFPSVIGSRLAVHQIIMNLFDNALKYGKPGTPIRISASIKHPFIVNEFRHGAGVRLTETAAAQMFQRGYRAEEARAIMASGTGTGMWISKQLMQAMQGELRAIPTENGQTRFLIKWRLTK